MDWLLCDGHGQPCFLKTGTKEGTSKGKSFYICSVGHDQCGFIKPISLPPSYCLIHEQNVVDLQALGTSGTTKQIRRYYRCSQFREVGQGWCGYTVTGQQEHSQVRQPLHDNNGKTVPTSMQSSKLVAKQNHYDNKNPSKPPVNTSSRLTSEDRSKTTHNLPTHVTKQKNNHGDGGHDVQNVPVQAANASPTYSSKHQQKQTTCSSNCSEEIKCSPNRAEQDINKSDWRRAANASSTELSKHQQKQTTCSSNRSEEIKCSPNSAEQDINKSDWRRAANASPTESSKHQQNQTASSSNSSEETTCSPNNAKQDLNQSGWRKTVSSDDSDDDCRDTRGRKSSDSSLCSQMTSSDSDRAQAHIKHASSQSTSPQTDKRSHKVPTSVNQRSSNQTESESFGVKDQSSSQVDDKVISSNVNQSQVPSNDILKKKQFPPYASNRVADEALTQLSSLHLFDKDHVTRNEKETGTSLQDQIQSSDKDRVKKLSSISNADPSGAVPKVHHSRPAIQLVSQVPTTVQPLSNQAPDAANHTNPATVVARAAEPHVSERPASFAMIQPLVSNVQPSSQQQLQQILMQAAADRSRKTDLEHILRNQKDLAKSLPLDRLPDKGLKIIQKIEYLEHEIETLNARLKQASIVEVTNPPVTPGTQSKLSNFFAYQSKNGPIQVPPHVMAYQYAAQPQMQTLYGGRMTASRLREVGSITRDAIDQLHKSLETCPAADAETEDPKGLKVPLMAHQRQALTWLIWREQQHPCGGILADDMGLGKTLTMISFVKKQRELQQEQAKKDDKEVESDNKQDFVKSHGTLVICPASLMVQWKGEVVKRCQTGEVSMHLYHGPKREKDPKKLAAYDMVFSTYGTVGKEVAVVCGDDKGDEPAVDSSSTASQPTLLQIGWERIILDEAHSIKNHKSQTAISICRLRAKARWAVTGTPIQNNLQDMFSLLRFLRCSPFDEYKVWKKQVDNNSQNGNKKLNILVKNILLRRTKNQESSSGGPLVKLPEKTYHSHDIELSPKERAVYDKLFDQSKSQVKKYIKMHEDKQDGIPSSSISNSANRSANVFSTVGASSQSSVANNQYPVAEMDQPNNPKMNASQILVMLLRLRQCCGHLSLLKQAVEEETCESDGIELSLVDQMREMGLTDNAIAQSRDTSESATQSDPLSDRMFVSTKINLVMKFLRDIRANGSLTNPDKSVIISQWTSMLDIMGEHLKKAGFRYSTIRGNVPAKKRGEIVEDFNTNHKGPEVMLVSLRAGGVGLNLVGGNHLFLLDMHWNPALEDQACDRVYRMGQKKPVSIHKFVCKHTIEERILSLQKKKAQLASDVLTGAKKKNQKLSLADLRFLFGV